MPLVKPSPLIIISGAAAHGRLAWAKVQSELDASRVVYKVHETRFAGDATDETRSALSNGCELIAVVGGDGTLSEAAAGFFESGDGGQSAPLPINPKAALAILPAGTGNDFALGLARYHAPLSHWTEHLVAYCHGEGTVRVVDVLYGRADDYSSPFICINAATLGIGGETAARVAAHGKVIRRFSGKTRFVIGALGALAAWRERRVRVSVDKEEIADGPMNLAAVANSRFAGGGMMLSPDAQIDDGKLDVVTASGLNHVHILRELMRIHKGGHVANPKVKIKQASYVCIETFRTEDAMLIEADGNLRGRTPADFRIMPAALRFVS